VKIPGAGELVLKGNGVKTVRNSDSQGGKVKLKIALTGKQENELQSNGELKVKISVTYTPTGGNPKTKHKTIPLIFTP
jgi:hypothetical protein